MIEKVDLWIKFQNNGIDAELINGTMKISEAENDIAEIVNKSRFYFEEYAEGLAHLVDGKIGRVYGDTHFLEQKEPIGVVLFGEVEASNGEIVDISIFTKEHRKKSL